jgi:hypothetical protein
VTSFAQRVLELGKDDAFALAASGWGLAYVVRDLEGGAALIDRALEVSLVIGCCSARMHKV